MTDQTAESKTLNTLMVTAPGVALAWKAGEALTNPENRAAVVAIARNLLTGSTAVGAIYQMGVKAIPAAKNAAAAGEEKIDALWQQDAPVIGYAFGKARAEVNETLRSYQKNDAFITACAAEDYLSPGLSQACKATKEVVASRGK